MGQLGRNRLGSLPRRVAIPLATHTQLMSSLRPSSLRRPPHSAPQRNPRRWRAPVFSALLGCLTLPTAGCFSLAVRIPAQVKGTRPDPGTTLAAAAADVVTAPLQLPLIVAAGIGEIRRRGEPESPAPRVGTDP